jgi:hypothetical protein
MPAPASALPVNEANQRARDAASPVNNEPKASVLRMHRCFWRRLWHDWFLRRSFASVDSIGDVLTEVLIF